MMLSIQHAVTLGLMIFALAVCEIIKGSEVETCNRGY